MWAVYRKKEWSKILWCVNSSKSQHIRWQHRHVENSQYINHDILYKKESYYFANEFRSRDQWRHCPHLHILSTSHQTEPVSFLPLRIQKCVDWKTSWSQQVLYCWTLTWFASTFLPLSSELSPFLQQPISASDCQHALQNVRVFLAFIPAHARCCGGVRYLATYRACMAILLAATSHERSIKTCRPSAVLGVIQGCTVAQKYGSKYSHLQVYESSMSPLAQIK